jgi:hypothetical protein
VLLQYQLVNSSIPQATPCAAASTSQEQAPLPSEYVQVPRVCQGLVNNTPQPPRCLLLCCAAGRARASKVLQAIDELLYTGMFRAGLALRCCCVVNSFG